MHTPYRFALCDLPGIGFTAEAFNLLNKDLLDVEIVEGYEGTTIPDINGLGVLEGRGMVVSDITVHA